MKSLLYLKKLFLPVLLLIGFTITAPASDIQKAHYWETQQDGRRITGTVTDGAGVPIIGVNIVEVGTTNGTITDVNDNYVLNNNQKLKYYCQRYSNNSNPAFADQEIMTIYVFAGHYQKYLQIKDIHSFALEYLSSWFPKSSSYKTFNLRLNRLSEAFRLLSGRLISSFMPADYCKGISLIDSLLVITCAGRNRQGKVAREITSRGYYSTKNQYCYGVKLHALTLRREGKIPFPDSPMVSLILTLPILLRTSYPHPEG